MAQPSKMKYILHELEAHAPFTTFGAILGVIFMFLFRNMSPATSHTLFNIFHPAHVLLSAVATAALFRAKAKNASLITIIIVGYIGSIGIATLSDSVIPYAGEVLLGFHMDAHGHAAAPEAEAQDDHADHTDHDHMETMTDNHDEEMDHDHSAAVEDHDDEAHDSHAEHHEDHDEHTEQLAVTEHDHDEEVVSAHDHDHDSHAKHGGAHIGFIESWYIVHPAAFLGILIALILPHTKFPHVSHVLLSIWASLFHILMTMGTDVTILQWIGIFGFLFVAVWLPCCISDIVFPLLFVKPGEELPKHTH